MKLSDKALADASFWEKAGITLPEFNRMEMIASTKQTPKWVHFGAGNIFRAFPAAIMQTLLDKGYEDTGIITVEGYDGEIIEKSYAAFDNLSVLVTLKSKGTTEKKVIGSIACALNIDSITRNNQDYKLLKDFFSSPSLQMASFTITEKGYNLSGNNGMLFRDIEEDIITGPAYPKSFLGKIVSLLYTRYTSGSYPIAMVSMDNCSHNGTALYTAAESIAKYWVTNGVVSAGFLDYIRNGNKVSFPCTMIDKITPGPDTGVRDMLISDGLENMEIYVTKKKTYIAPFVNAEETQYLIIEDIFPNGRPQLEKAGGTAGRIIFTDRETVDKAEKMKVCTCLNPLHTALSFFGTLLGYELVRDAMKDADLLKLLNGIGFIEGLPVVINPGIIDPKEFLKEVMEVRLTNPFLPDTLYRIAMDSSLKIPIRFGETIKTYIRNGKNCLSLNYIPLVFAGWLRYLLGINDMGLPFEVSPDPNYKALKTCLSGINFGKNSPVKAELQPILSNSSYFGVNLYDTNLAGKVEDFFLQMLTGTGAVRQVLASI